MAQKFIGLDDAAEQLGVPKERLNQLREGGKLRGYRDGASWKFRSDEIDKLGEEGLPPAEASDLSLDLEQDDNATVEDISIDLDEPLSAKVEDAVADSFDSIEIPDEPPTSDIDLGVVADDASAAASDLGLEDLDEPTVPVDATDAELDDEVKLEPLAMDDDDEEMESVLLSETEFGDSENRPPSTIIGKVDLDPTSDLDLVLESDEAAAPSQSDVRLASDDDIALAASDSSNGAGADPAASKAQFEDIEELEIDLEAESSRILSPDDAKQAREAAAQQSETSDIGLAPSDSAPGMSGPSSLELESADTGDGDARLTGISELAVGDESEDDGAGLTGISALELDDDDDVLGDGSDITLSSGDSGINIVSPSDSGLALDDVPMDLAGSAMGSSLDLGEAVEEAISLEAADDAGEAAGDDEDFLLTPVADDAADGDEESSSQEIAVDALTEPEGAEALLGDDDGGMLDDDFATGGLAAASAGSTTVTTVEDGFSLGTILGLTGCTLLLSLGGMMMVDLVRNIWSWNEPYALNSSLIDAILSLFPS